MTALLLALVACVRCPDGYDARGGSCEPTTAAVLATPRAPTAESFPGDYERKLCRELEDCWCDFVGTETCTFNLDCPRVDPPEGCAFDPVAAEECLTGRYECDDRGGEVRVEAPSACAEVYDCSGETGDTGAG